MRDESTRLFPGPGMRHNDVVLFKYFMSYLYAIQLYYSTYIKMFFFVNRAMRFKIRLYQRISSNQRKIVAKNYFHYEKERKEIEFGLQKSNSYSIQRS